MSPFFRRLAPLLLPCLLLGSPLKGEQCLVIGDSLTKEYEVEFPLLFPENPASWSARNWAEILHERRNAWFDLGRMSTYNFPRLVGHRFNWAFPGATTAEIRERLESWADIAWRWELDEQLKDDVERVVIFAGGNDVNSYYRSIYNGASATGYINDTRNNIQAIVNYVRGKNSKLPMVLVSVPHVGCTPKVQETCPTDPVKTARVTTALDSLNAQLATFAQSKGIAFVPGVYQMTKDIITQPFYIGGIEFYREADANSRPRYVFSGDGFHPATSAHGKIAQMVIEAFRAKYPAKPITVMTDREIVQDILKLDVGITTFADWIAAQPVPENQRGLTDDPDGDGLSNEMEFILAEADPAQPSPGLLIPSVVNEGGQKRLVWSWKIRPEATGWANVSLQQSANLTQWGAAPAGSVTTEAGGRLVFKAAANGKLFIRLKADR